MLIVDSSIVTPGDLYCYAPDDPTDQCSAGIDFNDDAPEDGLNYCCQASFVNIWPATSLHYDFNSAVDCQACKFLKSNH